MISRKVSPDTKPKNVSPDDDDKISRPIADTMCQKTLTVRQDHMRRILKMTLSINGPDDEFTILLSFVVVDNIAVEVDEVLFTAVLVEDVIDGAVLMPDGIGDLVEGNIASNPDDKGKLDEMADKLIVEAMLEEHEL